MKKADEILSTFFRMYNLEDGAEYVSFFESWQETVGVDLASHSRVADIQNGAAIVEMDHPGWMQMFQMREKKILTAIQKRFPDLGITRFSLRLVDADTWERRAPAQRKPAPPAETDAGRDAPAAADGGAVAGGSPSDTDTAEDPEVGKIPSPRLRDSLSRLKEDLEDKDEE
jgi:predicted nucleic acid-binding Zn ribbon protein